MKRFDAAEISRQIDQLIVLYPEMAEDEILRGDMIEAETDAFEFLSKIVRMIGENKTLAVATAAYAQEIRDRLDRINRREDALRDLLMKVMVSADIKKAELPEATISVRAT